MDYKLNQLVSEMYDTGLVNDYSKEVEQEITKAINVILNKAQPKEKLTVNKDDKNSPINCILMETERFIKVVSDNLSLISAQKETILPNISLNNDRSHYKVGSKTGI